ncbi:phosphatase PAP2 family protein [Gandjariella thermophila]|uniref:phosphatase PAP2 family protein n=1 Tax=Gandjariella thermophila TaxID=1931992 RepID=UPI001863BE11|nr:phosphatase PAP2 family protein [Gandjariella thermophila]
MGSLLPVLVAVTVVAAVGYAVGRWRMVLLAVLGPAAAIAVTESLKPLFGRTINDYWSFPSGHTTAVVSLLTVLALIWLRRPGRGVAVVVGSVFLVQAVLAAGMAIALIRLHLHYATDIAGGGCTGFAVVVVVAFVTERLGGRR